MILINCIQSCLPDWSYYNQMDLQWQKPAVVPQPTDAGIANNINILSIHIYLLFMQQKQRKQSNFVFV